MLDADGAYASIRSILGEKVRDELGPDGRQALFSAACMIAFCDYEFEDAEFVCTHALDRFLGVEGTGSRVTSRRFKREEIIARFGACKLSPASAEAVLGCLAFVAKADGTLKPKESDLLEIFGAALGKDAAASAAIVEKVAAPA